MPSAYPCDLCELSSSCLTVCMAPTTPSRPRFAVIGEAPGADEDREGVPFVGASGRVLWDELGQHELSRKEAFVTNVVKCRPPNNRDPKKKEIQACRDWLEAELDWLRHETACRVILAVGRFAYEALGGKNRISAANGIAYEYDGFTVIPTVHPASVLYSPANREMFRAAIAAFARAVKQGGVSPPTSEVRLVNAAG